MKGSKTATTKGATTKPKPAGAPCSCGCQDAAGGGCTCGQAVCFERPNYFGGQLLSDADLSTGQTYIREKQKLYHRALHGCGVVCGLRLTCDPDCCGHIRIGDGYAIDNCGNDIVVCQPASFDVVAALRAKNYLITDSPADPCDEEKPPRCKVKQCFYVTICYDEKPDEFTTPFKTNCGPNAAPCEPTRIKETFRFDVLECPPRPRNYLDELEERITCCWKVFTEGPLARMLQTHFGKDWTRDSEKDYCRIFCQLQVLFKHHLQRCPDRYDCTLFEQVCCLKCPPDDSRTWERSSDSFCKLFQLIVRYVYNCILGEMIFACPNPPKACCVGLGTVEVEDGKVLRVCNCPRTYVWTFANFFEVLLATVVGGAACAVHDSKVAKKDSQVPAEEGPASDGRPEHKEGGCCASFLIDCDQFLTLFQRQPQFGQFAAAAPVHTIRRVIESLKTGFNFTDALAFSPRIFEGMSSAEAQELAVKLAGDNQGAFQEFVNPKHYEAADPVAALVGHLLRRPGDDLAVTVATIAENKKIAAVVPQSQVLGSSLLDAKIDERIQAAEAKAAAAQASADTLTKQVLAGEKELSDLKALIAKIQDQLKSAPLAAPAPPPPAGPAPPGPQQ